MLAGVNAKVMLVTRRGAYVMLASRIPQPFLQGSKIRLSGPGVAVLKQFNHDRLDKKGMFYMTDDSEIAWHREQIAKNRTLLEEVEAGNTAGGDVFPETQSEIEHLKAQIAQSELIVAASEKTQD